ncbi:conserved hypothetical protein [Novosphingobium sp. 9U]|nr:conserved hypothetical protein [Novosphingobium sp. 9U]
MRKAFEITLLASGVGLAALLLLVGAKFGQTAPPTAIMEAAVGQASVNSGERRAAPQSAGTHVTLPELVYFGAAWQMLSKHTGMPPISLGGGYTNARVERTGDGLFFAGTIDRVDSTGKVTDVILAFAGAQGIGDLIQGEALASGRVLAEPKWADVLFERIWRDPRYAHARIHVAGHSLGAGYALFVGMEAVAAHGREAVNSRLSITVFGVPNWGPQSARYFGVDPHALDRVVTGYTALNDPVITNGGTDRTGVSVFLPAFKGLTGFKSMFNAVAAHWPTTYMTSLGLPSWLSPQQKAAYVKTVGTLLISGNSVDPNSGPPGRLPIIVEGSAQDDSISGTAGDDVIAGRGGRDLLRVGAGHDRFLYLEALDSGPAPERADRILDFAPGDRIGLSRMDADSSSPGRQSFTLIPARPFTAPRQLAVWSDGKATWIAGNVDRDNAADFLIQLDGDHHLSAADFVLEPLATNSALARYIDGKAAVLKSHRPVRQNSMVARAAWPSPWLEPCRSRCPVRSNRAC